MLPIPTHDLDDVHDKLSGLGTQARLRGSSLEFAQIVPHLSLGLGRVGGSVFSRGVWRQVVGDFLQDLDVALDPARRPAGVPVQTERLLYSVEPGRG